MRPKISVAICTKNRPQNLLRVVSMCAKLIPYDDIYVFEGSLHPNWSIHKKLRERFSVKVVQVPSTMKIGAVRNLAMKTCKSEYLAHVDDDVQLEKEWYNVLMSEFANPKVVAVSAKLIFGEGVIAKLCWANKRTSGGSAGAAIYNRKAILEIGNFNDKVHRGEDVELELRIWDAGKKWIKSQKTRAYHPLTIAEFLDRPKRNVCGWDFVMRRSSSRIKVKFMAKRFASTFVMPIYYLWGTFDPRCAGLWFIFKIKALLYYLSGRYLDWS